MQLLNGFVLTKEIKVQEETTKSGLIVMKTLIQRNYKELEIEKDVLNDKTKEVLISKGSRVYVTKHAGVPVDIENKEYVIINKKEIILSL